MPQHERASGNNADSTVQSGSNNADTETFTDNSINGQRSFASGRMPGRRPTAADVLRVQRTHGNRAVQRMLVTLSTNAEARQRQDTSAPARVVQREVLSNIVTEQIPGGGVGKTLLKIKDVVIGGRTPSPFSGTMGAHSTAWTAHIDEIRRQIIGLDVLSAANSLYTLGAHLLKSPLSALPEKGKEADYQGVMDLVSEEQRKKIGDAQVNLSANLGALKEVVKTDDAGKTLQVIRALIDAHLTLVNYLPSATVAGGDPAGHGEGSARGNVNAFEYLIVKARQTDPAADTALMGKIDSLGDDKYSVALKVQAKDRFKTPDKTLQELLREELWVLFAAETPDAFIGDSKINAERRLSVWSLMIKNFLQTLRMAYPHAYVYTEMEKPENQVLGLDSSLKNAGVTPDKTFSDALVKALTDGLDTTAATLRADGSDVAESDIQGAGAGFQSTILLDKDGLIGDVQMIGRTQSPFSGTMGAHSTAWIAHLDAVRRRLKGEKLSQAVKVLVILSKTLLVDQSLTLTNQVDEKHQVRLVEGYNALKNLSETPPDEGKPDFEQIAYLETLIKAYLTLMNFLPLSTIAVGKLPDGRGEGRARQTLLNYEAGQDPPKKNARGESLDKTTVLLEALLALYEEGPVLDYTDPTGGIREETDISEHVADYDDSHPMAKYIDQEEIVDEVDVQIITLNRFFHTVLEAYPRSVKDADLTSWRNARRDGYRKRKEDLTKPKDSGRKSGRTRLPMDRYNPTEKKSKKGSSKDKGKEKED
jgi:hypothetical protein